MCGGHLDLIPCSRVGHIFRHRRPYGSPDGQDTMLYNSLRVAHVWMDDYKVLLHVPPISFDHPLILFRITSSNTTNFASQPTSATSHPESSCAKS